MYDYHLELSAEVEAKLAEQARAVGLPVKGYLQAKVEELAASETLVAAETMLLSESSLAQDWLKPEEDAAWQNL